jgi:tripeptide aminopeptidase
LSEYFAGGHNFHGKYEYVPAESNAKKAVNVIVKIAELTAMPNWIRESKSKEKIIESFRT